MFVDLLASKGVVEELEVAGPVGVMALHGGLEAGTAELAALISRATGASRYAVVQPDDLRWHVPSIRYDPQESAQLARFLDHVDVAVSLHGYGRRGLETSVLLGGSNRHLAAELADALARTTAFEVVTDVEAIPRPLRGLHPANPVNIPRDGGVQMELPSGARDDDSLRRIAAAVASVIGGQPVLDRQDLR